VQSSVKPGDAKAEIRREFERTAAVDANGITADTEGDGQFVLRGRIRLGRSSTRRRAAWSVPGVST